MSTAPNFVDFVRFEEQALASKLDQIRLVIEHRGEKGRALEEPIKGLLRGLLPPEYGITTGFVVHLVPRQPDHPLDASQFDVVMSSQLDIIIYDAIRHAPLVSLASCDILPLEATYGYVEVKASICSSSDVAETAAGNSIEACIESNARLRSMRSRYFYETVSGSPIHVQLVARDAPAIRGYVVAYEASGTVACNPERFAQRMSNVLKAQHDAHLHGVLIVNSGFYSTEAVDARVARDEDCHHVHHTNDNALLAFRTHLLLTLGTFPRLEADVPALDLYYPHSHEWRRTVPQ